MAVDVCVCFVQRAFDRIVISSDRVTGHFVADEKRKDAEKNLLCSRLFLPALQFYRPDEIQTDVVTNDQLQLEIRRSYCIEGRRSRLGV